MEKQPLFSIITVTYNAADTVLTTLESVDAQLFLDYEHLVVDGASSDDTLAIIDAHPSPRRSVTSEPDKGIYYAMNKGIDLTTGKYLIFLNAGDSFHDIYTLEKIAKAIEENNEPGVVYGQTELVDKFGQYIGPRHLTAPEKLTLGSFAHGMLVCHQAFVALRKVTSHFDTRYRFSADFDWCIRCLQHSRKNVGLVDTVLIDYLSEGVTTRNHRASLKERFHIMCYYYGALPTIVRHFGFASRALRRKLK